MLREYLHEAADVVRRGGIVAYPTESCFGLGCDPRNSAAVRKILKLKRRVYHKGLILIAADIGQLQPYFGRLSPELQSQIRLSWPGPITWLIPARCGISRQLTGNSHKIAVRVTAFPVAALLCRWSRSALVSTSANKQGQAPATSARQVEAIFGDHLDYIVPLKTGGSERPSVIKDALSGAIIRH